jgi:hypothetical protein
MWSFLLFKNRAIEDKKKELDISYLEISSPNYLKSFWCLPALALADSEHLGAAGRTYPLRRWLAVLHNDGFSVAHLPLGAALYAIGLHGSSFLEAIWYLQYTIARLVSSSVYE